MKSNEKYVFFFDLLPPSVPCCRSAKFYLNMPADLDHVIILTSSTRLVALVYNMHDMDKWRICGKPEFNEIFLRLRWKLEDFDLIAG